MFWFKGGNLAALLVFWGAFFPGFASCLLAFLPVNICYLTKS